MRLVDADALKFSRGVKVNGITYISFEDIKKAPTVDAEPVRHGHWVDQCVRAWECSECGGKINKVRMVDGYCYDDLPNYCPDCGARMDEVS